MLRITLTPQQSQALEGLRRDVTLSPAERDRAEMILLSASGWSVPQIATHFQVCRATVRRLLHRFRPEEPDSLRRCRPGPPKDLARRKQVTAALQELLSQGRTWTAAQLAQARQELRELKRGRVGELTLAYLDECGFSPSQPVNYSWRS